MRSAPVRLQHLNLAPRLAAISRALVTWWATWKLMSAGVAWGEGGGRGGEGRFSIVIRSAAIASLLDMTLSAWEGRPSFGR